MATKLEEQLLKTASQLKKLRTIPSKLPTQKGKPLNKTQ